MPRTAKRAARRPPARRAPARSSGNGNGLSSRSLVVPDALAAIEACYRRGWTDGLPVIPPTEPAIRAMLPGQRWSPTT